MVEKQFIVIPHGEDRGWVIGCLPKKVNILYWNKDIKITSYIYPDHGRHKFISYVTTYTFN